MDERKIDFEGWERNAFTFIRERGLEDQFKDWSGGFPCPVPAAMIAAKERITELENAVGVAAAERMRAALEECAAPWGSPPTTIVGAAHYLSEEFQRRMNVAAAALAPTPEELWPAFMAEIAAKPNSRAT